MVINYTALQEGYWMSFLAAILEDTMTSPTSNGY